MNKSVALSFVAAATVALSAAFANASTVVDFSFDASPDGFPPSTEVVTGYLTFANVGDATAQSITLTSDIFGENSWNFSTVYVNSFAWSGTQITSGEIVADTALIGSDYWSVELNNYQTSHLECIEPYSNSICNDAMATSHVTYTTEVSPVPLPASFPLILTGLAGMGGIAGLKRRKRRNGEV